MGVNSYFKLQYIECTWGLKSITFERITTRWFIITSFSNTVLDFFYLLSPWVLCLNIYMWSNFHYTVEIRGFCPLDARKKGLKPDKKKNVRKYIESKHLCMVNGQKNSISIVVSMTYWLTYKKNDDKIFSNYATHDDVITWDWVSKSQIFLPPL